MFFYKFNDLLGSHDIKIPSWKSFQGIPYDQR